VVRVFALVLLSRCDRNRQSVFFRRQWTCCIRCHCAGRVVGTIEIDDYLSIHHGIRIEKSSARVSVSFAGEIADYKTQTFRWIAT